MRSAAILVLGLLSPIAALPAQAGVPNSVATLLGPSVGYLLAQNDLCEWDLGSTIRSTYERAFEQLGLTPGQAKIVWADVQIHEDNLDQLPAPAKARMRADTCTQAARAKLERDLAD